MTRNRRTARNAGTSFERTEADYLQRHVSEFIDRRPKTGAKDKGDLANVRTSHGHRVVVEAKDYGGQFKVGLWLNEAEVERLNDEALVGLVIAKRRGTTDPGDQVVITTVRDLVALITGTRP